MLKQTLGFLFLKKETYLVLFSLFFIAGCSGTHDRALKNEGYEPDGIGFIQAVKDNNSKAVGWFLKTPKVHSFEDKSGATAVFYAAGQQTPEMLNTLLSAGLPVELKDNSKKNPLHYAVESGCAQNVKTLLERGVDPSWQDNFERDAFNTLISQRKKEDVEIFELLVKAGVNLNSKDIDKKTPLIISAEKGFPNYMQKLINLKVSPLHKDYKGNTALDYATENYEKRVIGHEIFELLTEYTINIKGNL
ncbi:MAG: ankyrin repeat domain-containing protein [bacterium]